ncbi:hypothetical protein [Actinomyces respiraculi]|uniref:hypothetical protein n=1 Tax=Actinomyces respiraculi TaxID=2744574 RepID=UPI00142376D6|nr:hypothetical protein [Actinomyces respiraculi]
MSTMVESVSTPVLEMVRSPLADNTVEERHEATGGCADVSVVTTVLAVLAILSMFTAFAAVAGSMPVVVITALVSTVVCVVTAFRELRRAGM